MKIRIAGMADAGSIVELGKRMHAESRFCVYQMNEKKTRAAVENLISRPLSACILLAEPIEGVMAGMLAGQVSDYFFSDALVAQDNYFFVDAKFRGSSAALKLLIAFRRWAQNRNADELCINMSVDIEQERFNKLMRHMSFRSCGSNFVMRLQKAQT